ncbi:hypothetical protein [Aquimarina algiphila]|uniref:hypothetical protein n=1 Tax=Aquimarina algiphila TaxID=2047982 RepID=UPI00232DCD46|nr:hypothetical protein [Aquimarina algiphila]
MKALEEITCRVSKKRAIIIRATDANVSLSNEVFAINWFNTKNRSLYNFYNLLAARSVYKVGARPIFKGEITKKLIGNSDQHREMLLIVKYPSVASFKSLLDNLYFKLISVFRIKAVQDFNFGFSSKNDLSFNKTKDKSKIYIIHHYQGKVDRVWLQEMINLASKYKVHLFYSGSISSRLYVKDKKKEDKTIPCMLDGVLVWYADTEEDITSFVVDKTYKNLLTQVANSYVGILKRSL